ncbi:hypothetical protein [Paludibacterium denitrificans]|uniref:hypothetical protein n=1 Tax=Paludibacterium denitrificans TaxID=2675226 RepID=UPI001E39D7C8|nr:hypothetical protein [Paludibacterium denitrificans]
MHRITLDDAIADGLYKRICYVTGQTWSAEAEKKWRDDLYKNAPNPESADEEYGCIPKNSGGNWLSSLLIEKRMSADTPVLRYECPQGFELEPDYVRERHCQDWIDEVLQPELDKLPKDVRSFDGEDFARSGDLSVHVPLIELQNLVRRVPFILEMRNVPFRQQEQVTFHLLDALPGFAGGAFDARGNGQFLAEVAMQRYGADRIHQVMLSEGWYRENMPPVKAALEDGDLDGLPKDKDVLADLRAVQIINGVPRIPDTRTTGEDKGKRHGDVAVAVALARYAARVIDAAPLATKGYKGIGRGQFAASARFGRGTW